LSAVGAHAVQSFVSLDLRRRNDQHHCWRSPLPPRRRRRTPVSRQEFARRTLCASRSCRPRDLIRAEASPIARRRRGVFICRRRQPKFFGKPITSNLSMSSSTGFERTRPSGPPKPGSLTVILRASTPDSPGSRIRTPGRPFRRVVLIRKESVVRVDPERRGPTGARPVEESDPPNSCHLKPVDELLDRASGRPAQIETCLRNPRGWIQATNPPSSFNEW
jgi:hypothetical protein